MFHLYVYLALRGKTNLRLVMYTRGSGAAGRSSRCSNNRLEAICSLNPLIAPIVCTRVPARRDGMCFFFGLLLHMDVCCADPLLFDALSTP